MPKRELFTDDNVILEVHQGNAGSVTISMKSIDMKSPILIDLGKEDVDDLIKTLSNLSDGTPSIASIR
ncbi:MAG: hypothetical protein ABIT58_03520 [Ferruginibacter sp.]